MGTLGWVSLVIFAGIYYTVPKLYGREIHSVPLVNLHFWLAVIGQLIFSITMWIAGIQQATMLHATNPDGTLHYSFMETLIELYPYWYGRAFGGVLYFISMLIFVYNIVTTITGKNVQAVTQKV
jgi:cytochrome c oxidase cbb3-type subunit 1